MEAFLPYLPGLILAHTAVFLALMSPGPNILAVIGTSMGRTDRTGPISAGSVEWYTAT